MFKKNSLFLIAGLFLTSNVALGQTVSTDTQNVQSDVSVKVAPSTLKANLRRAALEVSSVNVSNAKAYENSPITELSADSQTLIKGVFDFVVEYNQEKLRWNNGLFMEYGKTKIKPAGEPTETNENSDKILLFTDYAYKAYKYDTIYFGPMFNVEYQTEFTRNADAPRNKVFRGKAGVTLFDGTIIKDLYIAAVGEYDMTYSEHVSKMAGEIGWRLEYDVREGVKLSTDGYYRDYFSYSQYIGTDLKYDLNAKARMDVKLFDNFTMGPYISYRQGEARETSLTGRNIGIGISIGYNNVYNLK